MMDRSIVNDDAAIQRTYTRCIISAIQASLLQRPDRTGIEVIRIGDRLTFYVSGQDNNIDLNREQMFTAEWDPVNGKLVSQALGFDDLSRGASVELIRDIGVAASHPQLSPWLRESFRIQFSEVKDGYLFSFSKAEGRGGVGSIQVAHVFKGSLKEIINGW